MKFGVKRGTDAMVMVLWRICNRYVAWSLFGVRIKRGTDAMVKPGVRVGIGIGFPFRSLSYCRILTYGVVVYGVII